MVKKYVIEEAAEDLLKTISRLIRSFKKTFFDKPKTKMDRNFYLINTALWMFFILGLIYIRTL